MPRSNPAPAIRLRSSLGWRTRLVGLLALSAGSYPLLLLGFTAALAFIGERHWITAALLYVPRLAFAAPLPVLVILLFYCGRRRLLWTQAVAALVILFPLMGLELWKPHESDSGPRLRVLSFNVDSANAGIKLIVRQVLEPRPDIAVLVEAPLDNHRLETALLGVFPYVRSSSQFIVASRFPITLVSELPHIPYFGHPRTSRALRIALDTPLGSVALYAVHPISPRGAFGLRRFRGLPRQLSKGNLFKNDGPVSAEVESDMLGSSGLRSLQIAGVARQIREETVPVIIAGDTNLPGLSPVLRHAFSGYQDGFAAAGWGFGYTFPEKQPFLRLDRIFAGPEFRFTSFHSGCRASSDHLCVWADLTRR